MRQLNENLFNELKDERSKLHALLEYVKADDTLDMEFRGNSFTLYYRGGALLIVEDNSDGTYNWKGINEKYLLKGKNRYDQKHKDAEQFDEYIPEAKHIIDRYIHLGPKNHLGEKEIQQLVVKDNNYSPNSQDTDYFIVDMEYTEGGDKDETRFDLIAVRWDSNGPARKKDEVSLAIIEVKQGYKSVKSSTSSPGLFKHQKDFDAFVDKKKKEKSLEAFCKDMVGIFKQKCELGLIKGNDRMGRMKIKDDIKCLPDIEFIYLLANYKDASSNFVAELNGNKANENMDRCKIIVSNYMGYGLFANNIIDISSGISNEGNTYLDAEKRKQALLFATEINKGVKSLFGSAKNFGGMWNKKWNKWYHYPYILKHEYSLNNLYSQIRQDVLEYFKLNDIEWWGQSDDRYFPTGNLVSSQIQCLNHLFAIRADYDAVLKIIQTQIPDIKEILPSPIDEKFCEMYKFPYETPSYISFEFTYNNKEYFKERCNKRGANCTSVDAFVYAKDDRGKYVLIPIEWKYTETYAKFIDKETYKKVVYVVKKRYLDKIATNDSHLTSWEKSYYLDPFYELARQSLLMARIISEKPFPADYYQHIVVCPTDNKEMWADAKTFKDSLSKYGNELFHIIDPKDFLAPISSLKDKNGRKKYADLIDYLQTRYWK